MTLNVLAWNSQGDRADTMWRLLGEMDSPAVRNPLPGPNLIPGLIPADSPDTDDLLIFVCEAGTPPWVNALADVSAEHAYTFQYGANNQAPWFNRSPVVGGIAEAVSRWGGRSRRRADALWVPWQLSTDPTPALRCSLSLYWFPGARSQLTCGFGSYRLVRNDAGRPLVTATIRRGNNDLAVLLFGHLPANHHTASAALPEMAGRAAQVVSSGLPLLVAGDLNINAFLPSAGGAVPSGWTALQTGRATQNSGGQLDWAIANRLLRVPAPTVVWTYNADASAAPPGKGPSDHAMLRYRLTL